jgi:type II protein arginine methyltransferase
MEQQGKKDKVEQVFQQAVKVLPSHPELLTNFGSFLFKQNQTERTERLFRTALESDPHFLTAEDRLENLSSALVERWHFSMLNDVFRNNCFESAICSRVREGCSTVLDIGTGTGILDGQEEAWAERVYAWEASEVKAVTAKDVLVNKVEGEWVRLIHKLSLDMDMDVPEKMTLLVTETFDSGLLGEHVLETMLHA